jgi:hypothetical protein
MGGLVKEFDKENQRISPDMIMRSRKVNYDMEGEDDGG